MLSLASFPTMMQRESPIRGFRVVASAFLKARASTSICETSRARSVTIPLPAAWRAALTKKTPRRPQPWHAP
jgi:hypothetical protein